MLSGTWGIFGAVLCSASSWMLIILLGSGYSVILLFPHQVLPQLQPACGLPLRCNYRKCFCAFATESGDGAGLHMLCPWSPSLILISMQYL